MLSSRYKLSLRDSVWLLDSVMILLWLLISFLLSFNKYLFNAYYGKYIGSLHWSIGTQIVNKQIYNMSGGCKCHWRKIKQGKGVQTWCRSGERVLFLHRWSEEALLQGDIRAVFKECRRHRNFQIKYSRGRHVKACISYLLLQNKLSQNLVA